MQTLNDIASNLGVSLQTIYNRKTEAEQRLGRKIEGNPHPSDKRKIVYDSEAIALISGQPMQAIEAVPAPQDEPDTDTTAPTLRAGGLVPYQRGAVTRTIAVFDVDAYQSDKAVLESDTQQQAAALSDMVAAYAQNRIAGVLADIDLVADTLRANALQRMGATPGKPDGDTAA